MTEHFHLDWETRCELDLEEVGLDVYSDHPSCEIIMANYARGDRKVQTWEPHLKSQIPAELEDAILDPFTTIHAWGAQFERTISRKLLKIDKPASEWYCVMAHARYLGLPGTLHDAGEVLGLGDAAKLRTGGGKTGKGHALIRFFCEPENEGGQETLLGISEATFRNAYTHPKEWATFKAYGIQDVIAERVAGKKLAKFPMPEQELAVYRLDQKVNDTGWPVDELLVGNARRIVELDIAPLFDKMREISGIDNPNSREQALEWLQNQGYVFSSLGKEFVARAMAGEGDLTPEAREFLEIRNQTAKSSVSKYTAIADQMAADARLRYCYTYYGAHTGRWTSHGVNTANLAKPSKAVEKKLELAVNLVREMDVDAIRREFGKPLEVAASVVRSAFRAPKGKKFVVADLNAIENRGLGYLARCEAILKVFKTTFTYEGPDVQVKGEWIRTGQQFSMCPYLDFATRLYKTPYPDLWYEYKVKGDSTKRTNSKPPVLGAGYSLGAGSEFVDSDGNKQWSGLMGYARKMGVELTQEQCTEAIKVFRQSYPEVKNLWKDFERAAVYSVRHPGQVVPVGIPMNDREREFYEERGRPIYDTPLVTFQTYGKRVLTMTLPSGRPLFYFDPEIRKEVRKWQGEEYEQDCLYYKGKHPKTKQWVTLPEPISGGKWTENADQAICRDVLVNGMQKADQIGFEIVGHTYDEVVTLVDANGSLGIDELCSCLTSPLPWCSQQDFPLSAEGFEDEIYRK